MIDWLTTVSVGPDPAGRLERTCDLSRNATLIRFRVYNQEGRPPSGGRPVVPEGKGRFQWKRVSAGAGTRRVRVVDREALLLDGVLEVDRGAVEVRDAHLVDDDLDPAEVGGRVAVEQALVEVELVDETRAAAGLHGDPQAEVVATLLLEQAADLVGRGRRTS